MKHKWVMAGATLAILLPGVARADEDHERHERHEREERREHEWREHRDPRLFLDEQAPVYRYDVPPNDPYYYNSPPDRRWNYPEDSDRAPEDSD